VYALETAGVGRARYGDDFGLIGYRGNNAQTRLIGRGKLEMHVLTLRCR
jgi:hypothetical protein